MSKPDTQPDTGSLEWKMICLARHVARLPSQAARTIWLQDYAEIHGGAARAELEAAARREYDAMKRKKEKP